MAMARAGAVSGAVRLCAAACWALLSPEGDRGQGSAWARRAGWRVGPLGVVEGRASWGRANWWQ